MERMELKKMSKEERLNQIQQEMVTWQNHNFPGRSSWIPLMGLGEELGELCDAHNEEELFDAIGDCGIYMADYCNAMGYSLEEICSMPRDKITELDLMHAEYVLKAYGRVCHSHLKMHQRIRMHEPHKQRAIESLSMIVSFLNQILESYDSTFEEAAYEVWQSVKQRDWQKNPNTAHQQ